MELKKDRDIPITDFYTNLQLEYLSYYMRGKVYKRPEDLKKFADICGKKREKIEGLSRKNCLPNIFNNQTYRERYLNLFIGEFGLPQFQYRDDYQRKVKGMWDKKYYFNEGTNVKVNVDGFIDVGVVIDNDHEKCKVTIRMSMDKSEITLLYDNVQRVFSEKFFEDLAN